MSLQNAAHVYHGKIVGSTVGTETKPVFTLVVTGSGTQADPYVVDKTVAEAIAAYNAGQCFMVRTSDGQYYATGAVSQGSIIGITTDLISVSGSDVSKHRLTLGSTDGSTWTVAVNTYELDISGKADKVSSATNGNFAGLDANGNLTDSGKKASDFLSGTVSVDNGGTGATSLTSGNALIGNGTGAVTTREITNLTSATTIPANNSLITSQSLRYSLNRGTCVANADINYTTAMARAIYATTTDLTAGTTALTNGTIALVYE